MRPGYAGPTSALCAPLCMSQSMCGLHPQESLTAKAFYCGDDKVGEATRMVTRMSGGYAGGSGGPGQSAPPDLPSLLLDARICYIGMPVRMIFPCKNHARKRAFLHNKISDSSWTTYSVVWLQGGEAVSATPARSATLIASAGPV